MRVQRLAPAGRLAACLGYQRITQTWVRGLRRYRGHGADARPAPTAALCPQSGDGAQRATASTRATELFDQYKSEFRKAYSSPTEARCECQVMAPPRHVARSPPAPWRPPAAAPEPPSELQSSSPVAEVALCGTPAPPACSKRLQVFLQNLDQLSQLGQEERSFPVGPNRFLDR